MINFYICLDFLRRGSKWKASKYLDRKLDDETKKSIKRAVWKTHSLLPHLSPSEYVDSLFPYVEAVFFLEECVKKPFIRGCSPDIVVKGKCIIEVNNASVYGSARDRIKQYVKALSLAGAQVHFQPYGLPKIYWYYLDLADEVHVESVIGETLYSEPANVVQSEGETDSFAAAVGIGLGILGAVAAGVLAYNAVSGTKEEEKEEEIRYSVENEGGTCASLMGKNSRKKYTFSEVYDIIEESAAKAKRNTTLVFSYRDYLHNQYLNRFSSILHDELHSKGVPFEIEKEFYYEGRIIKPDIYIKDIATVEVKAKKQLSSGDREQMKKYVAATGLPGILVNFGAHENPYIRIFYV